MEISELCCQGFLGRSGFVALDNEQRRSLYSPRKPTEGIGLRIPLPIENRETRKLTNQCQSQNRNWPIQRTHRSLAFGEQLWRDQFSKCPQKPHAKAHSFPLDVLEEKAFDAPIFGIFTARTISSWSFSHFLVTEPVSAHVAQARLA